MVNIHTPARQMPPTPEPTAATLDAHWRAKLRLSAGLLVLWFGVSFGVAYFARELSAGWFGWPFGFWVAAQGAPVLYGLLVWAYARRMLRLDVLLATKSPQPNDLDRHA